MRAKTGRELVPVPDTGASSWTFLPEPLRRLDRELTERLREAPLQLNDYGYDPYGFHPDTARRMLPGRGKRSRSR